MRSLTKIKNAEIKFIKSRFYQFFPFKFNCIRNECFVKLFEYNENSIGPEQLFADKLK